MLPNPILRRVEPDDDFMETQEMPSEREVVTKETQRKLIQTQREAEIQRFLPQKNNFKSKVTPPPANVEYTPFELPKAAPKPAPRRNQQENKKPENRFSENIRQQQNERRTVKSKKEPKKQLEKRFTENIKPTVPKKMATPPKAEAKKESEIEHDSFLITMMSPKKLFSESTFAKTMLPQSISSPMLGLTLLATTPFGFFINTYTFHIIIFPC